MVQYSGSRHLHIYTDNLTNSPDKVKINTQVGVLLGFRYLANPLK